MPRKKLTKAQGNKLLEDTKQRLRLEQEARTKARLLEDLEIEVLENLGRQLRLEYLELNGELECPETDTRRQYTLDTSEDEKDLVQEPKVGSDKKYTELESPD
jgi:hypothetical protein